MRLRAVFERSLDKKNSLELLMRSSRSVILLASQAFVAGFMFGCEPPPKPLPPPPPPMVATPEQQQQVATDLNTFGAAHVGRVNVVSGDDKLAAITGISDKDAKLGDVISILDVAGKIVANGTITSIYVDKDTAIPAIVVKYDVSSEGGRTPIKGDLAVTQLPTK
jgi:hypothetical protein